METNFEIFLIGLESRVTKWAEGRSDPEMREGGSILITDNKGGTVTLQV